jgi:hypothetical protein
MRLSLGAVASMTLVNIDRPYSPDQQRTDDAASFTFGQMSHVCCGL